jgi:excisionase family DNA binding protein
MARPIPGAPARRRLVAVQGAADYAGVHPRTLRRWIAAGLLTGYRAGPKLLRVDLDELDAMLRPIPTAGGPRDGA